MVNSIKKIQPVKGDLNTLEFTEVGDYALAHTSFNALVPDKIVVGPPTLPLDPDEAHAGNYIAQKMSVRLIRAIMCVDNENG
jgi:hypothetical protein